MSEIGLASGANANAETFALARDLELGSLQCSLAEAHADVSPRAEGDASTHDATAAFALMYARFSSGSQVHGRAFVVPRDPLKESARDDDTPEACTEGGRESRITSSSLQAAGPAAAAPAATSDFAAYALTPQSPSIDSSADRRQKERRRHREPEQREEIESQKPGYTIDDIVRFAGVTVAERRTPLIDIGNRAS